MKSCTGLFADVIHSDEHLDTAIDLLIDSHESLKTVLAEGDVCRLGTINLIHSDIFGSN